jgi:rhodanese-related sulfurtransferase
MKRNIRIFLVALTISLAFAFTTSLALAKDMTVKDFTEEAFKNITQILPADAKAMSDKNGAIFVDVREQDEYAAGHIPGAKSIPRGTVEWMIPKNFPDKNTSIIVYCEHGSRGALATYTILQMGYRNAKNLEGGRAAWMEQGFPGK